MEYLKLKLANSVAAVIMTAGLGFLGGAALTVATATQANAQTASTLTAAQTTTIQNQLKAALANATDDNAKALAISSAVTAAISTYGANAAGSITSALLVAASQAGVSPSVIGMGMAQAAAGLAARYPAAAIAIAQRIADVGSAALIGAFQTTSTSLGQTNLAAIAGASPTLLAPTGATGATGAQGGTGADFTGGGGGGASTGTSGGGSGGDVCLNPSCT